MYHISFVMFAGRGAVMNANTLYDNGAHIIFMSFTFAKLLGISVGPSLQEVRLGSD
jgi:hypothetical protein